MQGCRCRDSPSRTCTRLHPPRNPELKPFRITSRCMTADEYECFSVFELSGNSCRRQDTSACMRRAFVLVYCRCPDSTVHLITVLHYASSSLHRGLLKASLLGAGKKKLLLRSHPLKRMLEATWR